MSHLNIKDLYSTINEKTIKRMETYDEILQKCHKRIKYNSTLERTYCFFQIPEFVIGVPLYDINELRTYVMNSLGKDGFQLVYIEPNWLFIMWNVRGVKTFIQNGVNNLNNKKVKTGNYREINTYKPTGAFAYDESAMMGFADKLK